MYREPEFDQINRIEKLSQYLTECVGTFELVRFQIEILITTKFLMRNLELYLQVYCSNWQPHCC